MIELTRIKIDIIKELKNSIVDDGDLSDIGNEVGIAIGKYTMLKDASNKGLDIDSFICGLRHGVSLIDGTRC